MSREREAKLPPLVTDALVAFAETLRAVPTQSRFDAIVASWGALPPNLVGHASWPCQLAHCCRRSDYRATPAKRPFGGVDFSIDSFGDETYVRAPRVGVAVDVS